MHIFQPNNTLPVKDEVFVSTPTIRGTLGIVWSCLTVLLLCTWTIQLLNLPPHVRSDSSWTRIGRNVLRALNRVKWMSFVFIAPEMVTGKACADIFSARINEAEMRPLAEADRVEWGKGHAFFANMGGFVVRFGPRLIEREVRNSVNSPAEQREGENLGTSDVQKASNTVGTTKRDENQDPNDVPPTDLPTTRKTTTRSRMAIFKELVPNYDGRYELSSVAKDNYFGLDAFANKNSTSTLGSEVAEWKRDNRNATIVFKVIESAPRLDTRSRLSSIEWYWNMAALQGNIWSLDGRQLLLARQMGIIDTLPNVPSDLLDDRNKVDILIRLFTVLQILWLIIQIISRSIRGLPSSQLEIMTMAFAGCSIATYLILLRRPQGLTIPYYISAERYPTENEMSQIAAGGPGRPYSRRSFYSIPNTVLHYAGIGPRETIAFCLGTMAFTIAFGALHILAWRFSFPTDVECLLWRIATIGTTIIPVLCYLPAVAMLLLARSPGWMVVAVTAFALIGALAYVLCRLVILVEVFRTLYFLPPGAYITTWATNIPHIG